MTVPNQQTGWTQESKLLQYLSKQIERLIRAVSTGGGTVTSDSIITDPSDATAQATVQKTADLGNAVDGALAVQIVDENGVQITGFTTPDVNVAEVGGNAVDIGAGNAGTGTQRVSISTNDVNLSAIKTAIEIIDNFISGSRGLVTEDNSGAIKTAVEAIDNAVDGNYLNVNVNMAGTDAATGAGAVSSAVQRMTLASDDPAVALLRTIPLLMGDTYSSPYDFAVAYTSNVSVTASGSSFTIDDTVCKVKAIVYKPSGGSWAVLYNHHNGVSIAASSNVITVTGAGTPFAAGDTYEVIVRYQRKGYDSSTDTNKETCLNPEYARTTDPEPVIAAAQTLTTSYADVGYEIATSGYKTLGIWYKQTINSAQGCRIQVLAKHTSAASTEFNLAIEAVSSGLITISSEEIEFPNSSGLWLIKVQLDNIIPYVQIQAKETTDGGADATIDELNVTKGY